MAELNTEGLDRQQPVPARVEEGSLIAPVDGIRVGAITSRVIGIRTERSRPGAPTTGDVMTADDELQDALLAIHSRLGVIEGKVNLVARADRAHILNVLKSVIRDQPLVGQIYLLLDGKRTQADIREKLAETGIDASAMSVSRRINEMEREHGIAHLVSRSTAKVYQKDREMENVVNLSKNVREWLREDDHLVPEDETVRRRKRQ